MLMNRRVAGMAPSGLPGIDYRLACLADRQIAGIMTLPPAQMPPRPVWFGYLAVDDVDAKAKDIETAGGAFALVGMRKAEEK